MKYIVDHDMHIHSILSECVKNEKEQNKYSILKYAENNGLNTICLTDHYWDSDVLGASDWYKPQNFDHIINSRPLPQLENVRFLFGCETEMDMKCTIGIPRKRYDDFDFIIVPTTHLHMAGFVVNGTENAKERAELWIKRFDALLDSDLPFEKVGVAHLTCSLLYGIENPRYHEVIDLIPDKECHRLFKKASECGIGIELNFDSLNQTLEGLETLLRPYHIAKEEKCKFYLGSDSHHPKNFETAKKNFENIIDKLGLQEEDKFKLPIK